MSVKRRTRIRVEKTKRSVVKRTKEVRAEVRKQAMKTTHRWRRMVGVRHMWAGAVVVAILTIILSCSDVLHKVDQMVSDAFYQAIVQKQNDSLIKIISIDEETVKEYGEYKEWSRSKTAYLLEKMNEDSDSMPSVIGIDLDYSERRDAVGDAMLVDACSKYNNICLSASAVMEEREEEQSRRFSLPDRLSDDVVDEEKVLEVKQPFNSLLEQVVIGVVNNTRSSKDGYVRDVYLTVDVDGTEMDGFATAVYKMYRDSIGQNHLMPTRLDEDNSFQFTYSRKSKDYTVYSFADVAEGRISSSAFQDCIVLVGDYTNKENTFNVPNQRESQMHEIELQANVLEALMEQRTGKQVSRVFLAVFYAIFMALFFITTSYSSDRQTAVIAFLLGVLQMLGYWALTFFGYYANILIPLIMVVLITIYNLIVRYVIAVQNQYAMEDVFKKYVDESVVSELGKDGLIEAHIGVESKDIAVLFVDIRGFTSLSESLPPEQIVEILNDYLSLVAEAVAKHQGTLDKFIGDAAMAVFNSPGDLDDYEYRAVCAALDLRSNAAELNNKCQSEYGKQVAFGIGIQCGEAVIGNIGCESRMDFTAIGDTVNTASRLEGAAASGQILVSQELANRLRGRIKTVFAGEYELKGKKNAVPAYAVDGLMNTD